MQGYVVLTNSLSSYLQITQFQSLNRAKTSVLLLTLKNSASHGYTHSYSFKLKELEKNPKSLPMNTLH